MQKHGQEKAMLFLGSVPRSVERAVSCPTLPSGSVVNIGKEENCTHAITAPQKCVTFICYWQNIAGVHNPQTWLRRCTSDTFEQSTDTTPAACIQQYHASMSSECSLFSHPLQRN